MSEENYKFTFGKHKGESLTRVPVSYLRWILNQSDFKHKKVKELVQEEFKRRGSFLPELEISSHAIDRASTRCTKIWKNTRLKEEGLYSWLHRKAKEALQKGEPKDLAYYYIGIKWVFERGEEYPALKTVMPSNK